MIEHGSRILRANGASLDATAEDEFKQQTVMLPFERFIDMFAREREGSSKILPCPSS